MVFFSFLYLGSYVRLDQKNHPEISPCLISHGYRHRVADGYWNGGMSVCQRHVSHGISVNPESPLHHRYLHGAKSCSNFGGVWGVCGGSVVMMQNVIILKNFFESEAVQ